MPIIKSLQSMIKNVKVQKFKENQMNFFFQKSGILVKSSDFSGVDHISSLIDGLHLKYDIMIFFSGNLSGFRIFYGFFRNFLKFSDLTISLVIMDILLLKFTMMTLFSKSCSGFRILPVLPDFL